MIDCKEFDDSIDKMKRLFLYGYGVEKGQLTQYINLKVFSWAVPYVHQNSAELVSNLVQLVGAGILSKETGSEESGYGKNNEWDRLMREYKEEQQADLLYQLKTKQAQQQTTNKEGSDK